jgi:hypothetical protein
MDLTFPSDPLSENPIYKLRFKEPDRFAHEIERLFPDVNWDEQIQVPVPRSADAGVDDNPPAVPPARSRASRARKPAARGK